jgi:hypothetical protein
MYHLQRILLMLILDLIKNHLIYKLGSMLVSHYHIPLDSQLS